MENSSLESERMAWNLITSHGTPCEGCIDRCIGR